MRIRALSATSAALACLVLASNAHADPSNAALAQHLFDEGLRLLETGEVDRACASLAESQQLDAGGGTLVNLARCYEKQGRTASAWTTFREALDVARRERHAGRIAFCEEHLKGLDERMSHVTVHVDGRDEGFVLLLDNVKIGSALYDTPLPVDPGMHVLRASAPGHLPFVRDVSVASGESARIDLPRLAPEPEPSSATASNAAPAPATFAMPAVPARAAVRERPTLGWLGLGVGAGALATGAVFGGLTLSNEAIARDACPGGGACSDRRATDASERAHQFATISTASFVAGGALAAAGLAVLLWAPKGDVRATASGLAVRF